MLAPLLEILSLIEGLSLERGPLTNVALKRVGGGGDLPLPCQSLCGYSAADTCVASTGSAIPEGVTREEVGSRGQVRSVRATCARVLREGNSYLSRFGVWDLLPGLFGQRM